MTKDQTKKNMRLNDTKLSVPCPLIFDPPHNFRWFNPIYVEHPMDFAYVYKAATFTVGKIKRSLGLRKLKEHRKASSQTTAISISPNEHSQPGIFQSQPPAQAAG